jgi:SPP1 gp7 family putative phage head morphogenesis protein
MTFVEQMLTRRAHMGGRKKPNRTPRARPISSFEYQQALVRLIREVRDMVLAELVPSWPMMLAQQDVHEAPRHDALPSLTVATKMGHVTIIAGQYLNRTAPYAARKAAQNVEKRNKDNLAMQTMTVLGVTPMEHEPWLAEQMQAFADSNAALIKNASENAITQVSALTQQALVNGLDARSLQSQITDRFDVAESRARLIAVDQVAKLNSSLDQVRQQKIGVDEYFWRSSLDERVRPLHAHLEGRRCSWDSPPVSGTNGERLPPGQPIRCRCTAEPIFD